MKRPAWWATLAAAGLAASVLFADQGIVKTKDGSTFEGDVKETTTSVTVTIHGVDTVIPKTDVQLIQRAGDYEQDFRDRLSKLDPKDVAGRITMAREAFGRRRYDLAQNASESAVAIDPNNKDAIDMLNTVVSQIRAERAKAAVPEAPAPTVARPAVVAAPVDHALLTPADIENIRRRELRANDSSARVRFDGDVKKRFADSQNIPFPDFNQLAPLDQAQRILANGDESMRLQVHVTSDPDSMVVFRRQIQPLVMQNCATVGCHGANAGGGFMLLSPPENETVAYTNFYILQSYQKGNEGATGIFQQRVQRLIERGHGDRSLLASFGLPSTIGEFDHPPVRGHLIQPIFRNKDDVRYRTVVEWMDAYLVPVQPYYGIRYTPPLPTTQTADQPFGP
ncbi:MAG TPA: hypothetical protein VHD56_05430 [Tepidisphaeraceae bacterium]|nr:hypothetical protein [Tepidisphaeraceae bacterium]